METSKPPKKTTSAQVFIALIIVLVPFVIWVFSGSNKPVQPTTTYTSSITDKKVIDPATVQVFFSVKNTGHYAGIPTCLINVSNVTKTYSGYDSFNTDQQLKPGEGAIFNGNLTVKNEGAAFVTEGNIRCY